MIIVGSLLFGGKCAFQSLLYSEDGLRSDYMRSLTVFFSAACLADPDGFWRHNLPIHSPKCTDKHGKRTTLTEHVWIRCQFSVALTSPEHSILHRSPKPCSPFMQPSCFCCCFAAVILVIQRNEFYREHRTSFYQRITSARLTDSFNEVRCTFWCHDYFEEADILETALLTFQWQLHAAPS